MRRLIFLATLLLFISPCSWGTIAFVRAGTGCHVHAATCTITHSPTAGNNIHVGIGVYTNSASISSVKLSDNSSCAQDVSVVPGGQLNSVSFYTCANVPSGITSITVTLSGTAYAMAESAELSGEPSASYGDVFGTGNNSGGGTWTSGAITTTNASDVVLGYEYYGSTVTYTATSPWLAAATTTDSVNGQADILAYQIVSSTGSYNPTGTMSAGTGHDGVTASYKASGGGGGGGCALSMALMGVGCR